MIIGYEIEGAPIDRRKYIEKGFVFSDLDIRKREIKSSNGNNDAFEIVCDFSGFLINNDNDILVVYPKNFPVDLNSLESDSQLLFRVFMKTHNKKPSSMIGQSNATNIGSNYPFADFFKVYDYYLKFGLLFDDRKIVKPNQHGKIKWKDTISKGKIFIENGKSILFPFYYEKNYNFSTLLTESMIFVIDYTLEKFHSFIYLPETGRNFPEFDFLGNKEYI